MSIPRDTPQLNVLSGLSLSYSIASSILTICGVVMGSAALAMLAIAPVQAQQLPSTVVAQFESDSDDIDGLSEEEQLSESLPQEELEVFATAYEQLVELREEAKNDLADAIATEELTPERFVDIRDGNREEVARDELVRFSRAEGQVNRVRDTLENDMQKAVEEKGMTVERFQEIFAAVETTPELQSRLQQVWEARL